VTWSLYNREKIIAQNLKDKADGSEKQRKRWEQGSHVKEETVKVRQGLLASRSKRKSYQDSSITNTEGPIDFHPASASAYAAVAFTSPDPRDNHAYYTAFLQEKLRRTEEDQLEDPATSPYLSPHQRKRCKTQAPQTPGTRPSCSSTKAPQTPSAKKEVTWSLYNREKIIAQNLKDKADGSEKQRKRWEQGSHVKEETVKVRQGLLASRQKEADILYLRLEDLHKEIEEAKEATEEAEKEVEEFEHELVKAKIEEAEAATHLINQRRVISGLEFRIRFDDHEDSMMSSSVFDNLDPKQLRIIFKVEGLQDFQWETVKHIENTYLSVLIHGGHRDAQSLARMMRTLEKDRVASHARLKDYKLMLANIFGLDPPDLNSYGYPIRIRSWH